MPEIENQLPPVSPPSDTTNPTAEVKNSGNKLKTTLIFFFILAILGLIGFFGVNFFLSGQTSDSKLKQISGEWKGIIWTENGFITVNNDGRVVKDSNGKPISFLIPGMNNEETRKRYTDYDDGVFKNRLELFDNGQIVFIGGSDTDNATEEETLYSWNVGTNGKPTPIFTIINKQKIQRFTFSPDKKRVAVISVTNTEEEIYRKNQVDIKPSLEKLDKELSAIIVYNVSNGEKVQTIKSLDNEEITSIGWKGKYLYLTSFVFWIFDFNKKETIYSETSPSRVCSLGNLVVSADGSKYTCFSDQIVRDTATKQNKVKFSAPTYIGDHAFSFDSTKILVQQADKSLSPFLGDIEAIGEVTLADGRMTSFGKLESLVEGLQLRSSSESYYLPFAVYNPEGNSVIFTVGVQGTNLVGSSDVYFMKIGDDKAQRNNLSFEITPRNLTFLGWYKN